MHSIESCADLFRELKCPVQSSETFCDIYSAAGALGTAWHALIAHSGDTHIYADDVGGDFARGQRIEHQKLIQIASSEIASRLFGSGSQPRVVLEPINPHGSPQGQRAKHVHKLYSSVCHLNQFRGRGH